MVRREASTRGEKRHHTCNCCKEVNRQKSPFDSVGEIAAEAGLVGQILRRIPEPWCSSLLSEADKQAEPWKWLLSLSNVPRGFRQLFSAAQSQRKAIYRIAEMARGGGGIENSWGEKLVEAIKTGDTKTVLHAQEKVFASFWKYDHAKYLLEAARRESPAREAQVRNMAAQLHKKACRKLGRTKADALAKPAVFQLANIREKVAWCLVKGWLRVSNGLPGLCFFTDDALTDFIADHLKLPQLQFDTVRKTRQFLGLKKASACIYKVSKNEAGEWKFLDRHGKLI